MKNLTPSHRYLYLSAKLYELAAEFSESELQTVLHELGRDGGMPSAAQQAVAGLIRLHQSPSVKSSPSPSPRVTKRAQAPLNFASGGHAPALLSLFADRSAFPRVANIAAVVGVPTREKEARDRYLARVARQVDAMDELDQKEFYISLNTRLQKQPESFIARWSKVIKDT